MALFPFMKTQPKQENVFVAAMTNVSNSVHTVADEVHTVADDVDYRCGLLSCVADAMECITCQ